jgi:hypothetical protein
MKTTPASVVIALSMFFAVAFVTGCDDDDEDKTVEVLHNSTFNEGFSGPTSWYFVQNGTLHAQTWSKPTGSKNYCISVSSDVPEQSFSFWYQVIETNIPLKEKLTLTAKIKAENIAGQGVSIAVRCDNAQYQSLLFASSQGINNISGTFDWTEFKVVVPSPVPEDTKTILVYLIFQPNTTGKASFDDVKLTYPK